MKVMKNEERWKRLKGCGQNRVETERAGALAEQARALQSKKLNFNRRKRASLDNISASYDIKGTYLKAGVARDVMHTVT